MKFDLTPLIYEDGNISLGRVAFWVSFGISIYYWIVLLKDVPSSLSAVLVALLTYNLGKRYIDAKSQ